MANRAPRSPVTFEKLARSRAPNEQASNQSSPSAASRLSTSVCSLSNAKRSLFPLLNFLQSKQLELLPSLSFSILCCSPSNSSTRACAPAGVHGGGATLAVRGRSVSPRWPPPRLRGVAPPRRGSRHVRSVVSCGCSAGRGWMEAHEVMGSF